MYYVHLSVFLMSVCVGERQLVEGLASSHCLSSSFTRISALSFVLLLLTLLPLLLLLDDLYVV